MDAATYRKVVEQRHELADIIQFVRKPCNDGSRGYYRRIPRTNRDRTKRSIAQLEAQLLLAETAYDSFGKRGTDEDGIPIVASEVKKKMKGKRFKPAEYLRVIAKLLESLPKSESVIEEKT